MSDPSGPQPLPAASAQPGPAVQVFQAERAVPFYCPYCGEEDLEPLESDGEWHCRSCVRSFRLRFSGIGAIR
jgi:predicted RNA-binding Zn-ribbon protein involved in translation (DUF1610 family)